jgi:hypothetical protein
VHSAPTVDSQGPNQYDYFWLDASNHLREVRYNSGYIDSTDNPLDLGLDPAPGGTPVAVSWGPGRIDIFQLTGTRGGPNLYHRWFTGGAWSSWEVLYLANDPGLNVTYNVAVSSWGSGRLDVFALSQYDEIWHVAFDSSSGGWHGWEDLGGIGTSAPAAVSWGSGRIDLLVRGTDNAIYHKAWAGAWYPSQTGWEGLGGQMASAPTVASYQPNRLDIFATSASDGKLQHRVWDNAWEPWYTMGFAAPSQPVAISYGLGRFDLFALDSTQNLWQTWTQ